MSVEVIIAEDVRTDEQGNVLGDRIRVTMEDDDDHVHLYQESMQRHSNAEDKDHDWDWHATYDGLYLKRSHAEELRDALLEMLRR